MLLCGRERQLLRGSAPRLLMRVTKDEPAGASQKDALGPLARFEGEATGRPRMSDSLGNV